MQGSEKRIKPSDNSINEQERLGALLDDSDSGISAEEQNSILSQIDQMFDGGSAIKDAQELSYHPRKNGSLFPVMASITILLITVTAALLLFTLHNKQEQTILNQRSSIYSAEGVILREFRQETEQEQARSEKVMQDIRSELSILEQEREELVFRTEEIIEQHNQEFEKELQERLQEERSRLETSGMARSDIEEQVEQYREELTALHNQQLADVRVEAEDEIEVKEQQIEQLTKNYESRIEEHEGDRETALRDLANIQERQQEAQLLSAQISSAYLSAITALENDNYQDSRRSLGVVDDLLSRESVRSVLVTAQRLPADQKILSALSQFVNFKENSRTAEPSPQTENGIEELEETISQLREELQQKDDRIAAFTEATEQLTAQLQSTRNDLSQTRNQLGTARRELQNLRAVRNSMSARAERFNTLAKKLSRSSEMQQGDRENQEILAALSDKLEMLEMIKSDTVSRRYPDMEELFINYLDTFEQEYQRQGYLEALADTHLIIKSINSNGETAEEDSFRGDRSALLQRALQLVEELERLVNP
jgi:hypothetical protein